MLKKCLTTLFAIALAISGFGISAPKVTAEGLAYNLAEGKPVTYSGVEGGKKGDGSLTYPQFAAEHVVDGDIATRWSAEKADNQWVIIDLEKEYELGEIVVDFHAMSPDFELLASVDGENYEQLVHYEDPNQPKGTKTEQYIFNAQGAPGRFLKYQQNKMWNHTNNQSYGSSIYEISVFDNSYVPPVITDAKTQLAEIEDLAPTIDSSGNVILPELSSDDYKVELYGSDNQQVITLDGRYIVPLHAMHVNVLYKVTNITDENDVAFSAEDISFVVPGKHEVGLEDNDIPLVLPGLREWKGSSGQFKLLNTSRIISNDSTMETAKTIQDFIKDMLNLELEIVDSNPKSGDIVLERNGSVNDLGDEGYYLNIEDFITITSPTDIGLLYGGISIIQVFYTDDLVINKGIARDYPKYEIRAGMIDVGRMYIPLDYLEEMTVYMAWFKLNEIQVHVNDYWNGSGYSAFRLESTVYPEIVAKDGYYSKDDYRTYQINMKKYGIDVITEIDTPYHSEVFRAIDGAVMLGPGSLDIREQSSYTIIENLMDEYLDGDNPVIQSKNFHIGTDEYDKRYSEEMRKWTDHFINYVNDKGYETRLWGSLGTKGFNGTTPVSNKATMNLWAPYWADVREMYDAGYDMINTAGGWLYIVPGGNAGYPDRLNLDYLYNSFEVNNYLPNRSPGNGTAIMPVAHPQTKGAEFAIWNDMTSYKSGFTWFDVFDRMKAAVAITSEKTWYGEATDGQTAAGFIERVQALQDKVGGANPGRFVESQSSKIIEYDFSNVKDSTLKDLSENNYDGKIENFKQKKNFVEINSNTLINLPLDSVGYPFTVSLDVKIDSYEDDAVIFSGDDGTLLANIDGTGSVGYKRGDYRLTFNYELPLEEWINITFVGGKSNLSLYVDGVFVSQGKLMDPTIAGHPQRSGSFVLPTEEVMTGFTSSLDRLLIYNYELSEKEIFDLLDKEFVELPTATNFALKKDATASSTYPDRPWTPEKAVDGVIDDTTTKNSRWSSKRLNGENGTDSTSGDQWLMVDMLEDVLIDKVVINWEGAFAKEYIIQASNDQLEWTDLKIVKDGKVGSTTFDGLSKEMSETYRYIRVLGKVPNNKNYGYSIYELEVYTTPNADLERYVQNAITKLKEIPIGEEIGNIGADDFNNSMSRLEDLLQISKTEEINSETLVTLKEEVFEISEYIENNLVTYETLFNKIFEKMKTYQEREYTKDSWADLESELEEIYALFTSGDEDAETLYSRLIERNDALIRLNRTILEDKIVDLKALSKEIYTITSWDGLDELLILAQEALDLDSINQEVLDEHVKVLNEYELVLRGDITELATYFSNLDPKKYKDEDWLSSEELRLQVQFMIEQAYNYSQLEIDELFDSIKSMFENFEEIISIPWTPIEPGTPIIPWTPIEPGIPTIPWTPIEPGTPTIPLTPFEPSIPKEDEKPSDVENQLPSTGKSSDMLFSVGILIIGSLVVFFSRKEREDC